MPALALAKKCWEGGMAPYSTAYAVHVVVLCKACGKDIKLHDERTFMFLSLSVFTSYPQFYLSCRLIVVCVVQVVVAS